MMMTRVGEGVWVCGCVWVWVCVCVSVISKKLPNVYKSCPILISLEKLKILTPLQKRL